MKFLLLLCCILSYSCRQASNITQHENNTLHLDLTGKIETFDPAKSYDTISANILYQTYETLYQYHYLKRPYTLVPLLARSKPQISSDNLTYTIFLKKHVRYHDSPAFKGKIRYLKAQDIINAFKRLAFKPLRSSGWSAFDGKIEGLNQFRNKAGNSFSLFKKLNIDGLQAPNDYTLIIKLTAPFPEFIYLLSLTFTSPIPLEVIEFYHNDLSSVIVGTGPYELKHSPVDGEIELTKFKNYHPEFYPGQGDRLANKWGLLKDAGAKLPFINTIKFTTFKKGETKWKKFLNHKIEILPLPLKFYQSAITPLGRLKPELKRKGIRVLISPTLTTWWLSFNMRDPIVGKNRLLRKAIAHAIDIESFIKLFTHNLGLKANSIYAPGVPGYDPTKELPFSYDIKKAQQLLAQAGYPRGKGLPPLTYSVRGTSDSIYQQALFIKNQLSKIGIKIKIDRNKFNTFLKKSNMGQLQFWYDGWVMDYPDAGNTLQLLSKKSFPPGPNTTFYSNSKFETLLTKYRQLTDLSKKKQLMARMEDIVQYDQPWIMLFYARSYVLYHSQLKNYRHSDVIFNYIKYLKF